jgi:hypothetical protein
MYLPSHTHKATNPFALDIYSFAEQILFLWLGILECQETYIVVIFPQLVEIRQKSKDL